MARVFSRQNIYPLEDRTRAKNEWVVTMSLWSAKVGVILHRLRISQEYLSPVLDITSFISILFITQFLAKQELWTVAKSQKTCNRYQQLSLLLCKVNSWVIEKEIMVNRHIHTQTTTATNLQLFIITQFSWILEFKSENIKFRIKIYWCVLNSYQALLNL